MLSREFVNLIIESTRKSVEQTELAEEIEKIYVSLGGNYDNLEYPNNFDRYSYLFFKSIAMHITDADIRDRITMDVGTKVYRHIKNRLYPPAGESDDLEMIKNNLEQILHYFVENGYIDNAQILWDNFDDKAWNKQGTACFELVMGDPVILPGAQQLYKEEGFAQHYLSRTIEAALADFKVSGRETKDFDPTKFPADKVVELWELRKH